MRPSSIHPNQRFGKLLAIRIHHRNERGDAFWLTRCDCGRNHVARAIHLHAGSCRSCGCMGKETRRKIVAEARSEALAKIAMLPLLADGAYIPMTRGNVLIVPPESLEFMQQFDWAGIKPRHIWYAVAPMQIDGKRRVVSAHQLLMGLPKNQIDHEDGNGLDCRWKNMRNATASQNGANRGPNKGRELAKGVYEDRERGCFKVFITFREKGKLICRFLGRYADYADACSASLRARVARYGNFARIE